MHILLMDVGVLKLVLFDVVFKLLAILLKEVPLILSKLRILNHGAHSFEDLHIFGRSFHIIISVLY